jgi:hypothetical protein
MRRVDGERPGVAGGKDSREPRLARIGHIQVVKSRLDWQYALLSSPFRYIYVEQVAVLYDYQQV